MSVLDIGPVEPEPSRWELRAPTPDAPDLVAVGADLAPGTILAAYRLGLFPMGLGPGGAGSMGWWSPDPRGVLPPGAFHASRSLHRSRRRFEVTVDRAFTQLVARCADPSRDGRWITPEVASAYAELHRLGWAHSLEVWADGRLVGGLYGLAIGGLFAGESMFHRATDASKVAVWELTRRWYADGDPRRVIDVQWSTRHLASLGVVEWPRRHYLGRLDQALQVAEQPW